MLQILDSCMNMLYVRREDDCCGLGSMIRGIEWTFEGVWSRTALRWGLLCKGKFSESGTLPENEKGVDGGGGGVRGGWI